LPVDDQDAVKTKPKKREVPETIKEIYDFQRPKKIIQPSLEELRAEVYAQNPGDETIIKRHKVP
jgi:hypothetical protein